MMVRRGESRKELLKEPDQFFSLAGKIIAVGKSHLRTILVISGSALVLLLVGVAINQISSRNEQKASAAIETVVEKYRAALKDGTSEAAYEKTKNDFNTVLDTFDSKDATRLARIFFGDISFKGGDADAAVAAYSRALKDFNDSSALKNIVLSNLAHAYILKKEYPEAIRYFETVADGKDKTQKSDALFNLAWLFEQTGKKEQSVAMYDKLLSDFPGSIYVDMIKEKGRS